MKIQFSARLIPSLASLKRWLLGLSLMLGATVDVQTAYASGAANDHTVLILGSTVTFGASSREALAAIAHGMSVEVVSDADWLSKSQADFATYRALILGDPTCIGGTGPISAAENNRAVWSPVVNGNIIVIGTDPVFHATFDVGIQRTGAETIIQNGVAFVIDQPGKTGLYACLSCYYAGTGFVQPVTVLDQIGAFDTEGSPGCFNPVHIVATHPTLVGLTDANMSDWNCSVHEIFTSWPSSFDVLILALTGSAYTAADGSQGTPYVLARGAGLVRISNLTLTPGAAQNPVGSSHTVTATLTETAGGGGVPSPVAGATVTFTVKSGPNSGVTGTGVTDASGKATFTYTSNGTAGTDTIDASYTNPSGATLLSNDATKRWVGGPNLTVTPAGNRGLYTVSATSDGFLSTDLQIWVKDSGSAFVAGPFASGTTVCIKKSASARTGPGLGISTVTVFLLGNGVISAEDPYSQTSAPKTVRPL